MKLFRENAGVAIIGGGPAGLRAAEVISAEGFHTTLYDAKRSVGRKFLIAGKGGFNMTNAEKFDSFINRYTGSKMPVDFWENALKQFDNTMMRDWSEKLGVETFVQRSGRVYPKALKAAPLLRAWIKRLKEQGVIFKMKHRLVDLKSGKPNSLEFHTESGLEKRAADAVVLALGGGSWPMSGSDGKWISMLESMGISVSPLLSANCGWQCDWSEGFLLEAEAKPLKKIVVRAGNVEAKGELMITRYGLEGGPLYELGPVIRKLSSPVIAIDFKPTFTIEKLTAKMESAKKNFLQEARVRWKLEEGACALIKQLYGEPESAEQLAHFVKACRIPLTKARPIEEAISSAGGISWDEVSSQLMLEKAPGVYVAGEMVDWEAPTGGYLIQGAFATGTIVGNAIVKRMQTNF